MLKWLVSVKPRGSSESDTESAQEAIIGPPSSPSPSPENCSSENDPNSAKNYGLSKTTLTTKAKSFISPTVETIVTDDPLAALEKSISQSATGSTWSKPRLSSPFKRKQEQIYSVTRVNPLFYEIDEEFQQQHPTEAFLPMSASRFESQWSNVDPDCAKLQPSTQILPSMPGSPGKTASSSGYESLSRKPHLIGPSNNSSHSRFPPVPTRSSNLISKSVGSTTAATDAVAKPAVGTGKQAIGPARAQIVEQNTDYLVQIQMASEIPAPKRNPLALVSSNYELMSLPPSQPVPRPIWPGVPDKDQYHIPRVKSAASSTASQNSVNAATLKKLNESVIVQQDARYVTDVRVVLTPNMYQSHSDLLRQTSDESSSMSPAARGSCPYPFPPLPAHYYLSEDGIPMDSLLTNFPTLVEEDRFEDQTDFLDHPEWKSPVFRRNDAVLREFSEKLSQRHNLNKVSRAFSSSGNSSSHYGYLHRVDPDSQEPMKVPDATHFAKKVSAFKELWEKSGMKTNGRRLLIESDDDDERHVLAAKRRAFQEAELGTDSGLSSPSFRFGLVDERQTSANSFSFNPVHLPRPAGVLPSTTRSWDADRLSNSSRSSSSRRVTFSADTVDNEQSNPSLVPASPTKTSVTTGTESRTTGTAEELQLTPKFLPSPYKDHYDPEYHAGAFPNGAYKSHYTNNIVLYGTANKAISVGNGNSVPKTGIDVLPRYSLSRTHSSQAVPTDRTQKTWDTYYGTAKYPVLPGNTNNNVLSPAKTRIEKNALLHPNYGAACPDLDLCVDFTVDSQQPKSVSHKIVNRLCCSVMVLLGVGVFIVVVVGLSMYLTEGRRVFGPI